MNEIEKELAKENKEKKRTAASASHRVGSTKKCTLPYEMMDKKARKEYMKPSEVTTFQLRPMTLKEFRAVDGDKQIELLKWYGERYGWNAQGVASALGTTYATALKLLDSFMLTQMFKAKMKDCTKEQKAQFIENRKELAEQRYNDRQEAQQPKGQLTPPQAEKPSKAPSNGEQEGFLIQYNGNKQGYMLERQFEGIARSLDPTKEYRVSLLVVELPSDEDKRVCDVADSGLVNAV